MRVLVTGASGLLGSKLVNALRGGHEVVPTHNTGALHPDSMKIDIIDKERVLRVLGEVRPNAVIHAAAETSVDKCENSKEWARRINAEGTRNIAEASSRISAKLVYISTDYVFDGRKGLYVEEDETNPINYYGLTKLEGETYVRDLCEDFVIVRPSVLYGWHPGRLNFATWIIDSLRKGKGMSVVEDHYNSPTFVDDLAEIIERILVKDVAGVYHIAGNERISRYEFALRIAEAFELDKSLIAPVKMVDFKDGIAERPKDSSLCVDKLQKDAGIRPLGPKEALQRMRGVIVRGASGNRTV